jgi:hypothetical protein
MDAIEAANALAEIEQRHQQTLRQGSPQRLPGWFTYGSAAGLALASASHDATGWTATGMTLTAAVAMIALAAALERSTGVRLRMRAQRWTPVALFVLAVLTAMIGVGTLMRLYDVPADGTIAGLVGALVWITAMGPAQAAASTPRNIA